MQNRYDSEFSFYLDQLLVEAKSNLSGLWTHINDHLTSEEDYVIPMLIQKQNIRWQQNFDKERMKYASKSLSKPELIEELCFMVR